MRLSHRLGFLFAIGLVFFAVPCYAVVHTFTTFMDGPSEHMPNASPGTGTAQVDYDDLLHTLRVQAMFQDLTVAASAAHIHAATAMPFTGEAGVATPVPTFPGFPAGTSGTYDMLFDLTLASSWNGAYITANGGSPATAEAAFASAMASGRAYFNIHSSNFPAGEIRGFLVPEPATLALVTIGAAGVLVLRRRSKQQQR